MRLEDIRPNYYRMEQQERIDFIKSYRIKRIIDLKTTVSVTKKKKVEKVVQKKKGVKEKQVAITNEQLAMLKKFGLVK